MTIIYNTATTLNGYLADAEDSLDWLFAVDGTTPDTQPFFDHVAVLVTGSTTYEWILRHENLMNEPQKWQAFFGDRPMFVFTTRTLPTPEGANVRFLNGTVGQHLARIRQAADGRTVWVQGGGDLAGQFLDADALDEICLSIAPVFLNGGRPLLPRDVAADRLTLINANSVGQFIVARYKVAQSTAPAK